MKRLVSSLPLFAMAAILFTSGCGTLGETLLGVVKTATEDAIQTATSQAVDDAASRLESSVLQQITQGLAGFVAP
ncbi:MAG: hypothetical protein HZA51_11965 [Planctomycetes bacterium]|nr:hypothetical protein [Planctomycetota bacterium]